MAKREQIRVEWVLNIFENAKSDLELLKCIAGLNNITNKNREFSNELRKLKNFDREITKFIKELGSSEEIEDEEENERKLTEFKKELKQKFQTLCHKSRNLQLRTVANNKRNKNQKSTELINSLVSYFELKQTTLLSKEIETTSNRLTLKLIEAKQKENEVENIRAQLRTERQLHSDQNEEYNTKVGKLDTDLKKLNTAIKSKSELMKSRIEKEKSLLNGELNDKLSSELEKLKKELETESQQHAEQELDGKKKIKRMQQELNEIKTEYTDEMIELKKKYDHLHELEKNEAKLRDEIKIKVENLVSIREKIQAEEAEKRRLKEQLELKHQQSATKIQAQFRGWKTRNDLKKKKGKGKGKKKGKKK